MRGHQVDVIIDIKLGDAYADTYKHEPMTSLLARWENIKKYKHGKHCHNQRKHSSPFVLSVDNMLGSKALVVLSQISRVMADKREEPLSQVRGVGKRTHCNCRCGVLLTDDLQSSPFQSPAGMGTKLRYRIRDQDSRLNYTPG